MTFIKTTALLSTLLLTAAPLAASAQTEPGGPAVLTLSFEGIKTPSGRILAVLANSEAAYAGGPTELAAARGLVLDVSGSTARTTVEGLKPGRYAIRAFHDLDGDGKMSTNPFGMPTEPFAFSNNAMGTMGPAKWADAAFEIGSNGAAHTITID